MEDFARQCSNNVNYEEEELQLALGDFVLWLIDSYQNQLNKDEIKQTLLNYAKELKKPE
jgi:hypothetical protein